MRNVRLVLLLILSGLALLGSAFAATASADPAYPPATNCTVSSSDRSVTPGSSIAITGSGFAANTTVALTLQSGESLGSVHTDAQGSFTTSVTIPSGAAAHDRIVANAASTTCSFDPNEVVVPPAPQNQTPSTPTALTGFAAVTASVIAVALLGGGVLFVVLGRRRRAD